MNGQIIIYKSRRKDMKVYTIIYEGLIYEGLSIIYEGLSLPEEELTPTPGPPHVISSNTLPSPSNMAMPCSWQPGVLYRRRSMLSAMNDGLTDSD
jgi:hypothetical protein